MLNKLYSESFLAFVIFPTCWVSRNRIACDQMNIDGMLSNYAIKKPIQLYDRLLGFTEHNLCKKKISDIPIYILASIFQNIIYSGTTSALYWRWEHQFWIKLKKLSFCFSGRQKKYSISNRLRKGKESKMQYAKKIRWIMTL